jgi:hypothetical protein
MDNVPVHVNHGASAPNRSGDTNQKKNRRRGFKKPTLLSIGIILLVAAAVIGALTVYRSSVGSLIDGGKYQAVFLTNGQVYFGKLQALSGNYMRLTGIFYLQTKTADSTNPQQTSTDNSADVELIKLGSEIHGPSDEMIINNDQMLFFENLKSDGKVAQSIGAYQNK